MSANAVPLSSRVRVRWLVLAMLAVVGVLVLCERAYRTLEVEVTGGILRLIGDDGVYVAGARQTVYFGLGGDKPLGLQMTPECSSLFLLVPLVLLTAVLGYLRPANTRRLLVSLLVFALVVAAVNQLRMLLIVGLVDWFGVSTGYYWGHTLMGSLVSVIGGAIALVLFVWIGLRRGRAA
ncbi:exosortase/archaeosortase family protein [Amycolatopsis deserti]|uniref:Exosortase/archaeosortase family protein n=1 Tax=Amycolatopsis deserti TaxID=185696 RepID=A0ABQ3IAT3_9PSEU|nr:exosortase P [Amycolatopsis deserti]GHE77103.1 exosortase/archaeosortase family protein [Amycolatopsis deserti]